MDNRTALQALCTAIASTFYPDRAAVEMALLNFGIAPEGQARPKDTELFRAAVSLVIGYTETSRSEMSVTSATDRAAIMASIRHWCKQYGVEEQEVLAGHTREISDGSNLW